MFGFDLIRFMKNILMSIKLINWKQCNYWVITNDNKYLFNKKYCKRGYYHYGYHKDDNGNIM